MNEQATIYIIDDDASARKSLCFLIESAGLKYEAYWSAAEFLQSFDHSHVGCILLDVNMPDFNGLELQRELMARECDLPIIFISGYTDVSSIRKAFRNGAVDFLDKPVDDVQLLARIKDAFKLNIDRKTVKTSEEDFEKRKKLLTPREGEVLELILEGKTIKQIANHFEVSIQTAAKHRSRVLDKMQAENDVVLVNAFHKTKSVAEENEEAAVPETPISSDPQSDNPA
ncbi:MAG: FixJ family two-component response regulator [Pirellulaceae bacterium]|jgi:FixJ family two-component response regulator